MLELNVELKSENGNELVEVIEEKYHLGITNKDIKFFSHYISNDSSILTFKANVIDRGRYNELIEKERKLDKLMELMKSGL